MAYGYRRSAGAVWADTWIDTYNQTARAAVAAWRQGLDDTAEQNVDAMYRMAREYDRMAKK